ncbi:MAG: ABC transporter substrate-binding protein [Solirubrobacteraceae bacterium]
MALAGCGAVSAPTSSATKTPAVLPTVVIGKAVDTIPFTVLDVAIAQHLFEKNGVNVKVELMRGSSEANAAMVGGSLQFACEAANPLMLARQKGIPLISIDALDQGVTLQLVVSSKWLSAHPLPANASLKEKMAALDGAVFGEVSTTDLSYFHLLRSMAGLPVATGYRVEQIGTQAAIALAIQKGLIDVTMQSPPSSMRLIADGSAQNLVDRNDVGNWDNTAYDILVTTSTYAAAHPDTTRAVATAIAESLNFMRAHPNQTLAIEKQHFASLSPSVLEQSLKFIPLAPNGLQSQTGWDNAVALAKNTGVIKGVTSAPEGTYWTNKYIDTTKLGQ